MRRPTAIFSPLKLLSMDGMDDIERMKGTPNPFWNRRRFEITWSLPVMCGLLDTPSVVVENMRPATRAELELYHHPSYIETVELFGNMGSAFSSRFGLDTEECPVFRDMHLYAAYPVGASIDATMGVAENRFENAMSFYGGLHHALESKAAGFCYYNDCVIAIKRYQMQFPGKRVLYLDTDVHHGDGCQAAFYSNKDVLKISTHELSIGFFPGTGRTEEIGIGEGRGYSINLPLPPLTDDFGFWCVFEDVIVPIWSAYRPDLIFWDIGADAHMADPLADLMLTIDTYERMVKMVKQLTHRGGSKLVIVGGGGYDPVETARVWTIVFAEIANLTLPPELPREWIRLCEKYGCPVKRDGWTDRPTRVGVEHEQAVQRTIDETIKQVQELVFPTFGL